MINEGWSKINEDSVIHKDKDCEIGDDSPEGFQADPCGYPQIEVGKSLGSEVAFESKEHKSKGHYD